MTDAFSELVIGCGCPCCHSYVPQIESLKGDRDRWRSLANHLIRDLEFRTDPTAANFIVQQMVARIDRERAVRGE